jgi:hypothetical protein
MRQGVPEMGTLAIAGRQASRYVPAVKTASRCRRPVAAFARVARAGMIPVALATTFALHGAALAQGLGLSEPFEERRIEAVRIAIGNPDADAAVNARTIDRVRRELGLFPGGQFARERVEVVLARLRRQPDIADTAYAVAFGRTGGVEVDVTVTLAEPGVPDAAVGWLETGDPADLPVLWDRGGTYARVRLESLGIYYGNDDAWYGRPEAMLAGNPLVQGTPAGAGYSDWAEGFVHAGLYGITPLTPWLSAYGGFSAILSGSSGQELFTDETRDYLGVEDAFVGLVGGRTGAAGDRLVVNASAGRQRYLLGDGFLIANTSANGDERAALQSNPRWAADMLARVQLRYNTTLFEAFHLDPDELPVVDSGTRILGANIEAEPRPGLTVAGSALYVPESDFGYFTPTASFTREGLRVYDARFRWTPRAQGLSGAFLAGEAALQENSNFPMRATAFTGEIGYAFADLPWAPTLSYRYARFSGDDPDTERFERWDPLLSGGNGEQWVQGINHFKLYQNSNLEAHRIQARLRPRPTVELVPQVWFFDAVETTNLGGNPALSFLDSKDLGTEVNLTAKWFPNPRVFVQGHVAATFPGDAVESALGGDADTWWSTMLFVRIAL